MADGQVSVGGALSFAWGVLSQHWRAIWAALALNALSWTVFVAGLLSNNRELVLAGWLGALLTKYPLYGAVLRAAGPPAATPSRPPAPAHLGLNWGGPELRMLGADVLVGLFQAIMIMLLAVALTAPLVGVLMASGADLSKIQTPEEIISRLGPHGLQVLQGESLLFWLILAGIALRLSLSLVASAESGRVVALSTWRLVRGHFWSLAAATLVVSLPLILSLAVTGAVAPGAAAQAISPSEIFTYALLTGVLAGGATMPLLAGVQLYFYRRLGPVPPREDRKAKA